MDSRIFRWWLLAFLLGPFPAWAGTLLVDAGLPSLPLAGYVEILEDTEGRLQVSDLASPGIAGRFAPMRLAPGQEINFGYSPAVYWLRLSLAAKAPDQEWLLEVAFPSLDHLDFFAPSGQGFTQMSTGDRMPFSSRPVAHRNFVFPLHLSSTEPQTFYLRVESRGSLTLPMRLWQPEAFSAADRQTYAALGLYYGMLLALGLYNFLLYSVIRDRAYLYYVAFVASMAIGQLSLNGFGNQFLWPEWPAWGDAALVVGFNATGLFGALFTRRFLLTPTLPRLDRLIIGLATGFALAGLGIGLLPYRWMAIITSLLGVSFAVAAVLAGIASWRRGHPGARWFLLAWVVLLVGVAAMGLRNLSWLPTTFFSSYAMQIGSALEILLLSYALADRINTLRRDKEKAQVDALLARQREIQALQHNERELEARVAVRTRALAEANEKLLQTEERLRHIASHDPLTGLPNRSLLEERLRQAIEKTAGEGGMVAVLLIDLDGFKPVNDHYGHAVGDQVLTSLARRFQGKVRADDTVARLGGDEFVVVLGAIRRREVACAIAEKMIDAASEPVMADSLQMHLSASVGLAFWPEDGVSADGLLQCADAAMYSAKNAGRGRFSLSEGRDQPRG